MILKDVPIKSRRRAIRAYSKGEIVVTAPLARHMRLSNGDRIKLVYDNNGKLYLTKCDKGIPVRKKVKNNEVGSYRAYSISYSDILLKGQSKGLFTIGEIKEVEGKKYYTIIQKNNYAGQAEFKV